MPTLLRNFRSRTISTQTGNESLIPFDTLPHARAWDPLGWESITNPL